MAKKTNRKILSLEDLVVKIIGLRCAHPCQKIVLTTGVFDLVHPGHLDYFDKARSFGDVLIVSRFAAKLAGGFRSY